MNLRTGLLLFLLTPIIAFAQDSMRKESTIHAFSIQQCVDYAAKNNVQVKNSLLDLQIQNQTNRAITAAAYPQINGSIAATYNPNITVQSFPNFIAEATYGVLEQEGVKNGSGNTITSPAGGYGLIAAAFGTTWNANGGVSLNQVLFDGQVFVGLQARKTAIDFAAKNIEVTQQSIKANIYKIYYQLAASKTQLAQLNANIQRAQSLLHDANELYKNGFAEKLDVNKSNVQLVNLQTQKLSVLNTVANGFFSLKLLMGMPVKDSLTLTDSVSEEKLKKGLLDEGDYKYTDRKDFQYMELAEKLDQYNVKRYKLSELPTANLTGSYSKLAQRTSFTFFSEGPWFTSSYIGLNINIPIFGGFAKQAAIKKAQLQLEEQQNQIDNLKLSIDNDVAQATNNFHNAVITLDNQKENMNLAQEVYEETIKKYEAGTGSTIDITNAQADLTTAQNNYINAVYDAIIAKVDYMNATGKL